MTAWPLVWTIAPANPNWEGTVGNQLSFTVRAIPDPNFTVDDGGDGSGGTVTLPPQPTNIQVSVQNTNLPDNYYNVNGNTANVSVDDVRVFLPFTSIKFEKDGDVYQVQYEDDLNNIGYDFVFEFIPYPNEFDTRFITLRATSTSINDLTGTFSFRINNNFDAVRSALIGIVENGENFLSNIESGDGSPPSIDPPDNNEITITRPNFSGNYTEVDEDQLFPATNDTNIDGLVRTGNMNEVDTRIGNGSGLTKTPTTAKKRLDTLPDNPSNDDLQNWFDNLGE